MLPLLHPCLLVRLPASLPAGQVKPLLRSALREVTRQAAVAGILSVFCQYLLPCPLGQPLITLPGFRQVFAALFF